MIDKLQTIWNASAWIDYSTGIWDTAHLDSRLVDFGGGEREGEGRAEIINSIVFSACACPNTEEFWSLTLGKQKQKNQDRECSSADQTVHSLLEALEKQEGWP